MVILILGGHGFLGGNLVNALRKTTHEVYPFSRRDGLDLMDFNRIKECFSDIKPDAIINCAAHVGGVDYVCQYAGDVIHDNVQMALNIYRAAAKVFPNARIINPLSNCSYPGDAEIHYEPDWWKGEVHDSVYSYGNSKRMIYVLSYCYKIQYGIRTINFLAPNTFGPGDYTDPSKTHALNGMIIRMIRSYRNKEEEFEVWGSGNPIREWGYVKDIVNILIKGLTIEQDLIYPVNIAQNKGYSIRASAEKIAEAIGFNGKLVFNAEHQDGAPFKILDDKKFRLLFPDYQFYDHEAGIRETVNYYNSIL